MKKYLLFGIIFVIFVSIFSIEGIAQDASDTQVTIKMRNLGNDPSSGGTIANITVIMNRTGKLAYVEEYYSGSYAQPNFCCGSRYETVMNDYTVSFDLKRPDDNKNKLWIYVKSKVLLDGVVVYEEWTGTGGTYKSLLPEEPTNNNNSVVPTVRIKPVNPRPTEQYVDTVHDDNSTSGTNNIGNMKPMYNVTYVEGKTQNLPAIGIPVIIIVILSVYMFNKRNK